MTKAQNVIPAGYENTFTAISEAWSKETSTSPTWTPEVPEEGQCAVTALLLQEYRGGDLKRAIVNGESHYWNEIDGITVDFTRAQFDLPLDIDPPVERTREYVLSFASTVERYDELLKRVRIAPFMNP